MPGSSAAAGLGSEWEKTALTQQLQEAQRQFDQGNTAATAGQLGGFIMLVNSIGTLSPEEAQSLIDAANAILDQL